MGRDGAWVPRRCQGRDRCWIAKAPLGTVLQVGAISFCPGLVVSELQFLGGPRSGYASLRVHLGLDTERASGFVSDASEDGVWNAQLAPLVGSRAVWGWGRVCDTDGRLMAVVSHFSIFLWQGKEVHIGKK